MERKTDDHPVNHGEHAANDLPAIDWAAYHANTPILRLKKGPYETQKSQKKTAHR